MEKHSLNRALVVLNLFNLGLLAILLLAGIRIQYVLLTMTCSTFLIVFFTILRFNRQIGKIDRIAQKITRGERRERIPDLDVEEFDTIGRSINQMIGSLDDTIGHLSVHREELRLIIGSIEEALWSQSGDGRIWWANDAFSKLFPGFNPDQKQHYWELIRDPDLADFIGEFGKQSQRQIKEFVLDEHYYLIIASRNEEADRMIFTLQNIDPLRQAEQMKKDFIVNLAHELRTPLTAIKGFAEALADNAKGEDVRYVSIITNHTMRLIRLISDLEDLIRLEHARPISPQKTKLGVFFDNLAMILKPLAQEKKLTLDIDIKDRNRYAWVDPFKFEQIFINLVENSIRYTEQGGINISVDADESQILIDVRDSGIGIEPKHLPRIFERFYVADSSRNRAKGGTGLGLAIVKHIVQLHRGTISVSSTPGAGTRFLISLPNNGSAEKYWG
ncbi:MAG: ATP-binding protein [Candidatus Cloacimonadaceae bacterium]|nr:ATP-binding protein [Candidatus Cloacimonadaceae bacterium]